MYHIDNFWHKNGLWLNSSCTVVNDTSVGMLDGNLSSSHRILHGSDVDALIEQLAEAEREIIRILTAKEDSKKLSDYLIFKRKIISSNGHHLERQAEPLRDAAKQKKGTGSGAKKKKQRNT